jgi:FkbM family methyltransferase
VLLYRVLRVWRPPGYGRLRRVALKSGLEIHYRLNRGDIASLREVWLEDCYRLPSGSPRTVVDLGGNIGLTSLWLWHHYGVERVVCVEPDPSNAAIARLNLGVNRVPAEVVEAAIGPEPGRASFAASPESNTGRLGSGDLEVDVVDMHAMLERVGGRADLVKIDIEGGEAQLLERNTEWLQRVGAVIAEVHPTRVDYAAVIRRLEEAGLRYVPCDSAWEGSMDFWVSDGTA